MEIEIFERSRKWVLSVNGREILQFNSRASACMVRSIIEIDGEVLGNDS